MTEATEATEATNENVITFAIPNTDDTKMQVELEKVPANVRLDLLTKAIENYVRNSVNQANVRHTKAMEPWDAYTKACNVDPLQTAVPKPEGEHPTVDLIQVAKDARERLYAGNVKKTGVRKAKKTVDPLTNLVTQAVVRELFEKRKNEKGFKYTDAVKLVGGNGIAYLDALIAEKVAAGADQAELEKFKESRYIQPAKLMLGQRDTAGTKGNSLL